MVVVGGVEYTHAINDFRRPILNHTERKAQQTRVNRPKHHPIVPSSRPRLHKSRVRDRPAPCLLVLVCRIIHGAPRTPRGAMPSKKKGGRPEPLADSRQGIIVVRVGSRNQLKLLILTSWRPTN